MADIEIDVNAKNAQKTVEDWADATDDGAKRAVSAIAVLAESAMKAEAPEGAGFNNPSLRDSIKTKPPESTKTKNKRVVPTKRTGEGWLLVRAIVGQPSTPTYTDKRPPPGPLIDWARAKLGDPSAGWAIRESIYQDGHESFPDRFVDRSVAVWENEVEQVAGDAVKQALS
jgi:hypothetical protein